MDRREKWKEKKPKEIKAKPPVKQKTKPKRQFDSSKLAALLDKREKTQEIKEKKELEKIILCDVQNKIYPDLEKAFLNLVHNSGHPGIKLEKKIDFEQLYNSRFN